MNKKHGFVLFCSVFLALCMSGCTFFNRSLKLEMEEYTQRVAIEKHVFSDKYPHDSEGILSIPYTCTDSFRFILHNPQNYTLLPTATFASTLSKQPVSSDDYTLIQEEKGVVSLSFKPSYLKTIEGGTDLNPSVSVLEPKTGRTFGPYNVPLRVNSAPAPIEGAVIMMATTGPDIDTYILCFNMPDMSDVHKDIRTISVSSLSDSPFPVTPSGSASSGLADPPFLSSYPAGTLDPVTPTSPVFTPNARSVYVPTGIPTTSHTRITVTLSDEKGLVITVSVSSDATKLNPPSANPPSGSTLAVNASGTCTVTLSAPADNPDARVFYKATNTITSATKEGNDTGSVTVQLDADGDVWTIEAGATKNEFGDSEKVTFTYTTSSRIFYVKSDGDDANSGRRTQPFQTVQKAVDTVITANDGSPFIIVIQGDLGSGTHVFDSNNNDALIHIAPPRALNLTIKSDISGTNRTINAGRTAATSGRVLSVGANAKVTLQDLILTGGYSAGNGGGVYMQSGEFTMNGGAIKDNAAAVFGGGVYMKTGTFTITNGKITNNISHNGGVNGGHGGGGGFFMESGTATMNDGSVISSNTANAGNGGGVYVKTGTFTMNGGKIGGSASEKNITTAGSSGGGGVHVNEGTFILNNGEISYNESTSGAAGGGLRVEGFSARFEIHGGTISYNVGSGGGGIFTDGYVLMTGGSISNNESRDGYDGGGVIAKTGTFTMTGGEIKNNTTTGNGRGFYLESGTLELSGSPVITDNTNNGEKNNVYLSTGATITVTGALTNTASVGISMMTRGVFTGGYGAKGNSTPATHFSSDSSTYRVSASGSGTSMEAELGVITVYLNGTGGNDTNNGETVATAVQTFSKAKQLLAEGGTIRITETFVVSNAQSWDLSGMGSAAKVMRNTGFTGEIVRVTGSGALTLSDIVMDGASVPAAQPLVWVETSGSLTVSSGAVLKNNMTSGNGGGVYVDGGTFTMTGGTVSGNEATSGNGGGVYMQSGEFTMNGGEIKDSAAAVFGGGVYMKTGTFTITNGKISNNITHNGGVNGGHGGGGGFFMESGTATMNAGSVISSNTANKGNGGGVYVKTGTFTMNGGKIGGSTLEKNITTAGSSGGGGVHVNEGTFILNNGEISYNQSYTWTAGGGIRVEGASARLEIHGGTISHNTGYGAGGLFLNGIALMTGGSIEYNKSGENYNGGGVQIQTFSPGLTATFTMSGGTISNNTATGNGGGVYVDTGSVFNLLGSPVITGNKDNNGELNNLFLPGSDKITVTGALSDTASIGISMQTPGIFTSGYGANNSSAPATRFSSDDPTSSVSDSGTIPVEARLN